MEKADLEKVISENIKEYEENAELKVDWINVTRKNSVGFNINKKAIIEVNVKIKND